MGLLSILILIIIGGLIKKQSLVIKGLTISNVILKVKNISNGIKSKLIAFSIIRYLIFSFLFYNLVQFFGANESLLQLAPLIIAMYLFVSILPTIFIFDVIIRGGVALWIFSLAGIPEIAILSTVLTMWILNFVIPSIIGSIYLFTYTPESL